MDTSDEELVFLTLFEEEEKKKNKKKRLWSHDICSKREHFGEFHTLKEDLLRDRKKFFQYYRMSVEKFNELLFMLKDDLQKDNTRFRKSISPEERLAVCLRFLATGNSFRSMAFTFRMGESTVRSIVYETCSAIYQKLSPIVMPTPTEEKWKELEAGFKLKWNFPHCVGALDGKHIIIEAPPNSGSLYFCYKKVFSIVLLALVDADYRFVIVDIGGLGKNSDGNLFANSKFGKALKSGQLNLPADDFIPGIDLKMPYVIVGDEAFPLTRHLMRPYPGNQLNSDDDKKIFNYRLSRARRVSENAFGILVKRFRLYERRLSVLPNHVNKIALATCCLHNFLTDEICHLNEEEILEDCAVIETFQALPHTGYHAAQEAVNVRDQFKKYFMSHNGLVNWQWASITKGKKRNYRPFHS